MVIPYDMRVGKIYIKDLPEPVGIKHAKSYLCYLYVNIWYIASF